MQKYRNTNITVVPMEPLVPCQADVENGRINPFLHDHFNMGTQLGSNLVVMHSNFNHDECKWLTLVDCITGERVKIMFYRTENNNSAKEKEDSDEP